MQMFYRGKLAIDEGCTGWARRCYCQSYVYDRRGILVINESH